VLSVTIDTAVFAPPAPGSPKETVYGFITTLLDWRDAMDGGRASVYTSSRAGEVLMNGNLYPIRPHLKELLKQADIFEYDANTVAVLAETLLGRSGKIEDALRISDVLVDDLTIDPDVFSSHSPAALRTEAQRCAVVVSLASQYCDEPMIRGHAIALRAHHVSTAIRVRGLLQIIDHSRDDLAGLPMAPEYFEGSAVVCSSLHHLLMGLDEAAILRAAANISHVRAAITVALYKREVEGRLDPKWENLPQFEIGPEFLATLRAQNVPGNPGLAQRVIRSAVETIRHDNLPATHWLRKGRGGDDPQRMRGDDAAWRRDIDYEYHLHYWECGNGIVELAVVVVHNDFSIPE
jgi:hypothetical protein